MLLHVAGRDPKEMVQEVRISACLVVRNEEAVIERCLTSLRGVVDEIILVHDGPCEDRTLEIAEPFGCRTFVRPLLGNPESHTVFAYEQARGKWLLSPDADEFLSDEMAAVIPELIARDDFAGWEFRSPLWDGKRYTKRGPYTLRLLRRADTSLVGLLQSSEQVRGAIGRREELLHHEPPYNNFSARSVFSKWRRWCRIQALELTSPFADLPKFNYIGVNRWPWHRHVMNICSPVLAVPNGMAHFALALISAVRTRADLNVRIAFWQGVYATMLQFYVARSVYIERPMRHIRAARQSRSGAGAQQ
jgi:glycosyltransferase involved in cell wall biosynthesis